MSSGSTQPIVKQARFSFDSHSGTINTDNKAQRSAGVCIMQGTINNSSYLNALLCVLVYNPVKEPVKQEVFAALFTI